MDKLLGFLDSLESLVTESKQIPMTNKVIIQQDQLLILVQKMRDLIKTKGEIIQTEVIAPSYNGSLQTDPLLDNHLTQDSTDANTQTHEIDLQTKQRIAQEAEKIKEGSHIYADDVLANLQLVTTKIQNDILRIKKTIENGRQLIENKKKETFHQELNNETT